MWDITELAHIKKEVIPFLRHRKLAVELENGRLYLMTIILPDDRRADRDHEWKRTEIDVSVVREGRIDLIPEAFTKHFDEEEVRKLLARACKRLDEFKKAREVCERALNMPKKEREAVAAQLLREAAAQIEDSNILDGFRARTKIGMATLILDYNTVKRGFNERDLKWWP